jgi:cytochrome P450
MDRSPLVPEWPPISVDWCAHHFDHLSPQFGDAITETLEVMRSRCPVAYSDQWGGFWVVTRYEDVVRIAQDWETFSSAHGVAVPDSAAPVAALPLMIDPPLQRTFKRLITPFFSPATVASYERPTRALVTRLIDGFIEAGVCEFMNAFALPLPGLMFFDLVLHAPSDEVAEVNRLATTAATPTNPESRSCYAALLAWVDEFVGRRRHQPPRGDVVDAVVRADIDGRPITHDEVLGVVSLLIFGGLDTTAGALGLMMARLCREPEIAERLRRQPEVLPAAVEELLRLDSSLVLMARTATRDAEVGGRTVKNGDKVVISWVSANRDEAEFACPAAFDLQRTSNRHITFGAGPHRCAGSNLARQNLRVALGELLRRLDDIRLQEGAEPVRLHSAITRAPLALPIMFKPGPRMAAPDALTADPATG